MWFFPKIWLITLCFGALARIGFAQEAGHLPLSLENLQQEPSLSLNQNVWTIDPDPDDTSLDIAVFSSGTHPKQFVTQPSMRAGKTTATFRLTIELKQKAALSVLVPEYPFYELYLGDRLLIQHGQLPNAPQRLYREVPLGEAETFPLVLTVHRFHDFHAPYTNFKIGLTPDIAHRQQLAEFYGAFFLGLIIITALYHFSLSFIIPQNKPSFYFAILLVCLALRASLSDVEQILIRMYPQFSWEWSWKLGFIGYFGFAPAYTSFLYYLFPGTIPRFALPLLWTLLLMMSTLTLLTDVSVYSVWNNAYHLCSLFTLVLCIIGYTRALRRNLPGARLSLISVVINCLAVVNDLLVITNQINTQPLADYSIIAFIFSQTAIISYNYANAFRDIVHVHRQLQKLVYKHVVTQIAGGRILEETMPVGAQEAVVLAFDVIGSSRIKHSGFHRALERVMAQCQEILHETYDPEKVAAKGYRIKEMGDGLLASIGFPLANLAKESNADTAITIAVRFCQVFEKEMSALQYHEPMHCSIGIAQGIVEGFFPKSGIKQYDVRGRPLILANRYESMRNILFKSTGETSSLIFIQDAVYKNLSPALRHEFRHWDCTEKGHRIRDDLHAIHAWYRRMPGTQGRTIAVIDSIGPGPSGVSKAT